ncbi:ABC transporter substrate-binding protein [Vineibacter terrae]|uniref:ABC transporter substrate-binding protein n=1 Tax=Vineibacter terrae TaxID=2586908 RepID=UPI002E35F2C7|nr:ABC transporter substrate-binding protein [Vineibacter terrae]HEX2890564.1 ABC transporter substrate-binding protein [Vineibacter terrae]
MTGSSRRYPFGIRSDGSIDRRAFLQAAGRLGVGALGASSLGLAAGVARADAEPFKIGWVRPTTGRLASSFSVLYIGGLIAIDEINKAGGILGRPIVRQEEDDEASPAKEPAVIKKLQEAGLTYIAGPTGSSQALSSLATTTPAKIISATYANGAEMGDGKKYPYHYQCTFNTDQQGEVAARYLVDTIKAKKIGILQENTAFGEQATAASRATLKKAGVEPTRVEVYPLNAPDLNTYVGNLRKAGCDGLIAWIANIPNAAMAFNAMNAQKWFPAITGHNGLFLDALFDLVPDEALKNVYGTMYRSLMWSDGESPGPRQVEFAKKVVAYPEAKGSGTTVANSPYYDFLHILKMVIEGEKTFDTDKVKRALDNVRGYKGLLGTVNFTPENHTAIAIEDVALASVASGKDPKSLGVFRERAK